MEQNSTIENIATFHKELRSFMKNLIKVFPDDREVKLVSSSVTISIMDDPDNLVIKDFFNSLSPHQQLIATKDDSLFRNQIIKSGKNDADHTLFKNVSIYWNKLDQYNKDVVWQYITCLYTLSKQIVETI
jgi:hypothetical protein